LRDRPTTPSCRAVRELDRERRKLEMQNERVASDIRKAAKANQMVRAGAPAAGPSTHPHPHTWECPRPAWGCGRITD
jgi:hypothetical protein